jgi:hypothetical protein
MPILSRQSVGVKRDIHRPSARKSGRPLAPQMIAIREAIHELTIVSHVDDVAWAKEQAVEDSEREILERIAGAVQE